MCMMMMVNQRHRYVCGQRLDKIEGIENGWKSHHSTAVCLCSYCKDGKFQLHGLWPKSRSYKVLLPFWINQSVWARSQSIRSLLLFDLSELFCEIQQNYWLSVPILGDQRKISTLKSALWVLYIPHMIMLYA